MEDSERKRRKDLGMKMLMSRESSFGGAMGSKSHDRASTYKSMMDDSLVNHKLEQQHQNRRKFD